MHKIQSKICLLKDVLCHKISECESHTVRGYFYLYVSSVVFSDALSSIVLIHKAYIEVCKQILVVLLFILCHICSFCLNTMENKNGTAVKWIFVEYRKFLPDCYTPASIFKCNKNCSHLNFVSTFFVVILNVLCVCWPSWPEITL